MAMDSTKPHPPHAESTAGLREFAAEEGSGGDDDDGGADGEDGEGDAEEADGEN